MCLAWRSVAGKFLPQHARTLTFPEEAWDTAVHGAHVLETLFQELSACRVSYDKIRHGVALTRWLLQHKPEVLQPIADAMSALLEGHSGQ